MAQQIVADPKTWTAARRKADGKPFFFIPSSEDPKRLYMTARDGCTCPSAQWAKDGKCKHSRRVADAERQQAATVSEDQRRRMAGLLSNE